MSKTAVMSKKDGFFYFLASQIDSLGLQILQSCLSFKPNKYRQYSGWLFQGMHRNHKMLFRPEPEFAGTKNKNLAGTGIFLEARIFL